MNVFRLVLFTVVLGCIGCASTPPAMSPAELQEYERLRVNEDQAIQRLLTGEIHAGQSIEEMLRLCQPYRIDFVERYAFVQFYSAPNLHGLSLIAIDGKLVSALRWNCVSSEAFFEAMDDEQRQAASAAYEPRLYGYPR